MTSARSHPTTAAVKKRTANTGIATSQPNTSNMNYGVGVAGSSAASAAVAASRASDEAFNWSSWA